MDDGAEGSSSGRDPKDIHGHSVEDVVKGYRVKEDGVLAYYLQEREIEHHYARNVEERRLMIDDLKTAKELQDAEDRLAEEQRIRDAELAKAVQQKLLQEEELKRRKAEERDRMMAAHVLDSDLRREKSQLEHDRRMSEKLVKEQMKHKSRRSASRERFDDHDDRRMSHGRNGNMDLRRRPREPHDSSRSSRDPQRSRGPPRSMNDEDIARRLQQEEEMKREGPPRKPPQPLSDAELARRLQQEEERGVKDDRKIVVEMQDEELAKYIQEQEREAEEQMFYKERMMMMKKKKNKNGWKSSSSSKRNPCKLHPYTAEEEEERLRYEQEQLRNYNQNNSRSSSHLASSSSSSKSRPDRPPQPNNQHHSHPVASQRSSSGRPSRPPPPSSSQSSKKLPPLLPENGPVSSLPKFYTEEDFDIVPTQDLGRMNLNSHMSSQRELPSHTRRHTINHEQHDHPNEDLNKFVASSRGKPRRSTAKR